MSPEIPQMTADERLLAILRKLEAELANHPLLADFRDRISDTAAFVERGGLKP